jgi:hypothetical protein
MTALQKLIYDLRNDNDVSLLNDIHMQAYLDKERGQIADAYSDGAEAQRDSKYIGMKEYLKKIYNEK